MWWSDVRAGLEGAWYTWWVARMVMGAEERAMMVIQIYVFSLENLSRRGYFVRDVDELWVGLRRVWAIGK